MSNPKDSRPTGEPSAHEDVKKLISKLPQRPPLTPGYGPKGVTPKQEQYLGTLEERIGRMAEDIRDIKALLTTIAQEINSEHK
jgi:hypothetical protein